MLSLIKLLLRWISGALDPLFKWMSRTDLSEVKCVRIYLAKSFGIGDYLMLSKLINALSTKYKVAVDYKFSDQLLFEGINLEDSAKFNPRNVLTIYPSPNIHNLLDVLYNRSGFLGFLAQNKLFINGNVIIKESLEESHYTDRFDAIVNYVCDDYECVEYPHLELTPTELPYENYIAVAPYCNWQARRVKMKVLIKRLMQMNMPCVIVGGQDSEEIAYNSEFRILCELHGLKVTDTTGTTKLSEVAYIIAKSACYLGNDSGLTHIAFLVNVKVQVFDGCVPADLRIPVRDQKDQNIDFFAKARSCQFFPCYSGFNEPVCNNRSLYFCLPKEDDIAESNN